MVAQAQSSAKIEYKDAVPTVPGHTGGNEANDNEPSAHKANAGGGSGGGSNSPGGGSSKGGSSEKAAAAGNGGGSDQQGSQGHRAGKGPGQPGTQASATVPSESDGGSSPLVPILIAIAVLAAISIGVVVMRQRRRGDPSSGSPVSPEAG